MLNLNIYAFGGYTLFICVIVQSISMALNVNVSLSENDSDDVGDV